MYLIINWHRFNPTTSIYNSYGWWYVPDWFYADYGYPSNYAGVAEVCIDFWDLSVSSMNQEREYYYDVLEYTANRYKDNPYVMISPRNEPQHFLFGYTDNEAHGQRIVDGYYGISTESIDRMRATGFDGLIFIETPYGLSNYRWRENDMQDISRSNIVYEYHEYVSGRSDLSNWKTHTLAAKNIVDGFNKPFYLGEWHFNEPSDKSNGGFNYVTSEQINYIDNVLQCSDAIHNYGRFFGYDNWVNHGYTSSEINYYISLQSAR